MRIKIETPIIKGMIGFVLLLTMFIFFSGTVKAEGSADLVKNGGYRPYTEWTSKSTSGLVRHQIIKAFVKEGETVYFGSSVTKSELLGGDIAIKDPNGSTTTYTNTKSKGYIETPARNRRVLQHWLGRVDILHTPLRPRLQGFMFLSFTPLMVMRGIQKRRPWKKLGSRMICLWPPGILR